jgi:hypothetical protein
MDLLRKHLDLIDIVVVGDEHTDLLPEEVRDSFEVGARIMSGGRPSLAIYVGNADTKLNPVVLSSERYGQMYDNLYTDLASIVDLPLGQMRELRVKLEQSAKP